MATDSCWRQRAWAQICSQVFPVRRSTHPLQVELAEGRADCDDPALLRATPRNTGPSLPNGDGLGSLPGKEGPPRCSAAPRRLPPLALHQEARRRGRTEGNGKSKTTQDVPQGEARWGLFAQMVVDTEKVGCTGEFCPASRRSACPGFTASPRMWEAVPQSVAFAGKSLVRRLVLARIVRHHLAAWRVGKRSLCAAGQPALARWRKPRARKAYVRQVETDALP